MRRLLVINVWLCNCAILNFIIYEGKFGFFFIGVQSYKNSCLMFMKENFASPYSLIGTVGWDDFWTSHRIQDIEWRISKFLLVLVELWPHLVYSKRAPRFFYNSWGLSWVIISNHVRWYEYIMPGALRGQNTIFIFSLPRKKISLCVSPY